MHATQHLFEHFHLMFSRHAGQEPEEPVPKAASGLSEAVIDQSSSIKADVCMQFPLDSHHRRFVSSSFR
jgi:hypothetical protein